MAVESMTTTYPGLGTGMYSFEAASALLRVPLSTLRRWASGYSYLLGSTLTTVPSVLQRSDRMPGVLTFLDVYELGWVKAFKEAGVSLGDIRAAADRLALKYATNYPLATRRLVHAGPSIIDREGKDLYVAGTGQQVFDFVKPWLTNVSYRNDQVSRWYPLGRQAGVVIDPERSLGAPITTRGGFRTEILYSSYLAEGEDLQVVAYWYGTTTAVVRAAVEFERWLMTPS